MTNPKRNAKKFSIMTDAAEMFGAPPDGAMEVTVSLKLGANECAETIPMNFKKGKLSYKATH